MDPKLVLRDLLEGRKFWIEVGRFKFQFNRPDEMALVRIGAGEPFARIELVVLQQYCIAWEGVLEKDIVGPNGAGDAVTFDKALYSAWIADRADLWEPIAEKIKAEIEGNRKRIEALKGN